MDNFGVCFLGCRTCSQPCSRSSARLLQASVPLLRSPFESRVPSEQAQPVRLLAEVATSGPPNWTRGHDGRRLTHLLSSVPGTGVGPTPPGRRLRCLEPNGDNHTKTLFFVSWLSRSAFIRRAAMLPMEPVSASNVSKLPPFRILEPSGHVLGQRRGSCRGIHS